MKAVAEMFLLIERGEEGTSGEDYVRILGAFENLVSMAEYLNKRGPESFPADLYWQHWKALDTYGLHQEGRIRRQQHITYTYSIDTQV